MSSLPDPMRWTPTAGESLTDASPLATKWRPLLRPFRLPRYRKLARTFYCFQPCRGCGADIGGYFACLLDENPYHPSCLFLREERRRHKYRKLAELEAEEWCTEFERRIPAMSREKLDRLRRLIATARAGGKP